MYRKLAVSLAFSLCFYFLKAGTGESVYQFLELPMSSVAAGNGGNNVSSPVEDMNLVFCNPALLSPGMNDKVTFGYLNYLADINAGSLAYSRKIDDSRQWMAGVRYIDYGSMPWTTEDNVILGTTYARDLALSGTYSWMLSERWRAGGSINFIYSVLDEYTSAAIAADLGVFYNNPDNLFSAGMTIMHLGSQIVSYDGQYESMPWDIRVGVSRKLEHAPFRFTVTAQHLNQRSLTYLEENTVTETKESGIKKVADDIFSHALLGVDFIPSEQFMLNFGYNYRRVSELGIAQRTFFGGFSAGMMLQMKQMKVGASFARYHVGGSSLQMTLSLDTSIFGL